MLQEGVHATLEAVRGIGMHGVLARLAGNYLRCEACSLQEEIGCAYPGGELREIDVRGRNLAEGIPRSFTLNSHEILDALQEPLAAIVSVVKIALEKSPPELASDIAERGLVLTGGGALLRDIDKLIAEETGLPVIIAEDPLTCVARGGGRALEMIDETGTDLFTSE